MVSITKRGCVFGLAAIATALLAFFLWPYRLETVEHIVSENDTGCEISMTSNSGWNDEILVPGIKASRVAYPLDVSIFVDGCRDVAEGRPYSADIVSASSGHVIARGMSCAATDHSEGYPCRLDLPPLASLTKQDRYLVRVRNWEGETVRTADLQLYLNSEWRSVVIDMIMSA